MGSSRDRARRKPSWLRLISPPSASPAHTHTRTQRPSDSTGSALTCLDLNPPSVGPAASPPPPASTTLLLPSDPTTTSPLEIYLQVLPHLPVLPTPEPRPAQSRTRSSASCCPLAPAPRSASGLAINICDVLVEEGGPRVEAKRRGGDPLPRARCRAKSRERAGSRVVVWGGRLIDDHPRRTTPKTNRPRRYSCVRRTAGRDNARGPSALPSRPMEPVPTPQPSCPPRHLNLIPPVASERVGVSL